MFPRDLCAREHDQNQLCEENVRDSCIQEDSIRMPQHAACCQFGYVYSCRTLLFMFSVWRANMVKSLQIHAQDKVYTACPHERTQGKHPRKLLNAFTVCQYRNSITHMHAVHRYKRQQTINTCSPILSVTADVSSSMTCMTRYNGKCSNYARNFVGRFRTWTPPAWVRRHQMCGRVIPIAQYRSRGIPYTYC